ncbi:hypothetical protein [Nocardia macrotermitis]|uniref:Uncharacterized protein n=1 Tax=Nocardia macrotermitis TaxID=2585198 RepID=A0A7K0CYN5_9NOCA|nr:hypothetical protein [Nocardia macrotermitis]MQY18561.1 hypothetical protein [Nocardia macrotermitis]
MVSVGKFRGGARLVIVAGVVGAAVMVGAGTAFAADGIDVTGVGPSNVKVVYSCDASAGVAAIGVMAGDPQADRPAATGRQTDVTCDGAQHTTVVVLQGTPLSGGRQVQVRAALVDRNDTVVKGIAKLFTLG